MQPVPIDRAMRFSLHQDVGRIELAVNKRQRQVNKQSIRALIDRRCSRAPVEPRRRAATTARKTPGHIGAGATRKRVVDAIGPATWPHDARRPYPRFATGAPHPRAPEIAHTGLARRSLRKISRVPSERLLRTDRRFRFHGEIAETVRPDRALLEEGIRLRFLKIIGRTVPSSRNTSNSQSSNSSIGHRLRSMRRMRPTARSSVL